MAWKPPSTKAKLARAGLVLLGLAFVLILILALQGLLPRIDRCDQRAGSIYYEGPCTY